MWCRRRRAHGLFSAVILILCIGAQPEMAAAQSKDNLAPADSAPLQEVTVTADRMRDHGALYHAVSGFVESHSAPGARINQIGRWYQTICPFVAGLRPPFNEFVARQIVDVARGVGAPVRPVGKKCDPNVEIIFTADPQELLNHIAKSYRLLLGFERGAQVKRAMTFSRPIQAWYETGTRSLEPYQPPIGGLALTPTTGDMQPCPACGNPFMTGLQVDSDVTAAGMQPSSYAGSRLGVGLRSEFLHVVIIADSRQVAGYSLRSIADYAAMLSLTRMAQLEDCAPLSSITDLLANGCTAPAPNALTAADRAYLKALYAANLEKNLNVERGDLHEQMMRQIEGH
jgi:hypothetical protein